MVNPAFDGYEGSQMKIQDILKVKGDHVETIAPDETIRQAMDKIINKRIGALIVMEEDNVKGIITERDIARLIHKDGEKAFAGAVRDTMTRKLIVGLPDDEVDLAMALMTNNRFRHLPVMNGKRLVGIISIGDIVKAQVKNLEIENRYLIDYIIGKYPA